MIALDFVQNLKALPACLRVEPQNGGGWLIECPGCSSHHPGGSVAALNQIGPDIVVRCYGGCDEAELVFRACSTQLLRIAAKLLPIFYSKLLY